MHQKIILASESQARQSLMRSAGVIFDAVATRVDETQIRASLTAEGASARDVADALAEIKARKLSEKHPDAFVIGCDQVIDFEGQIIGKAEDREFLLRQLKQMRGKRHDLLSAVVIYQNGKPLWRHIGKVRLTMHALSDRYLEDYLDRNWQIVRHAAGGYMLEGEGVRLMSQVNGDYFTVLGLPLVEVLTFLGDHGILDR